MQTGQHKDKYFAACFILQLQPKRDPENPREILMKKDDNGNLVVAGTDWISRKTELCYWSDKSVAEAKAGLKKHIKDKGFKEDPERTDSEECGVVDSVKRFAKSAEDKKAAEEKREEERLERAAEAKAAQDKIDKASEESAS